MEGKAQSGAPVFADVRDVARAHLLAAETPSAKGRYIVANSHSLPASQIAAWFKVSALPAARTAVFDPLMSAAHGAVLDPLSSSCFARLALTAAGAVPRVCVRGWRGLRAQGCHRQQQGAARAGAADHASAQHAGGHGGDDDAAGAGAPPPRISATTTPPVPLVAIHPSFAAAALPHFAL